MQTSHMSKAEKPGETEPTLGLASGTLVGEILGDCKEPDGVCHKIMQHRGAVVPVICLPQRS